MILIMLVSLYTSRVILNALGAADYGVYNVVGGVVAMIAFLNGSINSSTQRFLNVEMGKGNRADLQGVFSTAINAHVIIGIVVVIILETVGVWFVSTKLIIPSGQRIEAMWVFQCSVVSFFLGIISSPYNAAIVANEKMSIFAVLSLLEAFLKLIIAWLITIFPSDRLKYYGILIMLVSIIMRVAYGRVCIANFKECRYQFNINRSKLKEMFTFSGWMIFGCFADVLSGQGVNMLINLFFGPVINASRAIAVQVQSAVSQFSNNFLMSVNPQIVKSYSSGEVDEAYRLVFSSSKFSFYLMMILVIPISINTEQILHIWLKNVPPFSSIFVNLVLLEYLIRSSYTPIAQINVAYGRIKAYQISVACLFLLNFIGTYYLFKLGYEVYSTFILSAAIAFVGLFVRLFILHKQNGFPTSLYLKKVSIPVFIIFCLSYTPTLLLSLVWSKSILSMICSVFVSLIFSFTFIWVLGLSNSEKGLIKKFYHSTISKFNKSA